ncbi:AAA family ATPase [Janthinobacterium sp. SUN073]|uniref:AAA family ATPase n=1 Tax=Janthinobacterium sp. SUN073 TaxID=3004102 RepID=UPI0025B0930C|nr:AAA family ATPase [Janthinobacterium sp. SUN073]MDN2699296.1 AAA family ATPase [Janthinobacterium sp. SUN073]
MKSVFLNGTVGVGKSTTAEHLGAHLIAHKIPHAVIDLDSIRQLWPAPEGDPFNLEIELLNLAAVAANFERAGAQCLVIAGVIENVSTAARYRAALRDGQLSICRLTAPAGTVEQRLRSRHVNDAEGLQWHLHRSIELDSILHAANVDDVVIDSAEKSPDEIAKKVFAVLGWTTNLVL